MAWYGKITFVVVVTVIPDTPTISFGDLVDGEGAQDIQCKADNGYPDEGDVWWYTPNNMITKLTPTYDTDNSICKADLTSILSYTPKKADNGVHITCEVHHRSSDTQFPSATKALNVKCKCTVSMF